MVIMRNLLRLSRLSIRTKICFLVLSLVCISTIYFSASVYLPNTVGFKIRSKSFDSTELKDVSCFQLILGSESEQMKAKRLMSVNNRTSKPIKTENCGEFVREMGFITEYLSDDEREFPIAFAIEMYKDVEQTVRLLRAIYRPQNLYCIHVDAKSAESIYNTLAFVASCFDNVFLPAERVKVVYATYTDLEPEIVCLRELLQRSNKWKYFINLTGQEFPLKTNYELVKILQAYNGANDISGTKKGMYKQRYGSMKLPHNLTAIKGSVHIMASRPFIEFAVMSPIGKTFLRWIEKKKPEFPGELFYPTLANNPQLHIPGQYRGGPDTSHFYARFKIWYDKKLCHGKLVRGVCVFGIGDLPLLTTALGAFANKFHYEYEPLAYDCLEEWYMNKTRKEYSGELSFDNTIYKSFAFVRDVNKV